MGGRVRVLGTHRQSFLRRFDLEHTFRLLKQTLGWTRPKIRTPAAVRRRDRDRAVSSAEEIETSRLAVPAPTAGASPPKPRARTR